MASFIHLILVLATCTAPTIVATALPSSTADKCSTVIMGMMDCLDYVQLGSKEPAPSKMCCGELTTVINTSPSCLCEGFKMAGDMGIKLDMGRAMGLPHACNLPVPANAASCALSPAPAPAPVPVPPFAPSKPVTPNPPPQPAPSPAPVSPAPPALPTLPPPPPPQVHILPVPAPAPIASGSWQLTTSRLVLCVAAAVASFSCL